MNLALAALILVGSVAAGIGAMLFVRRRAPDGGYFNDGDRAAGVFGVLATGFAVLVGFVVFLAFTSYDSARAGAENEARIVAQQVETAQLMPANVREDLSAQLICYGRSVAGVQWDRMEDGSLGEHINPWAGELFRTLTEADPQTPSEQAAYEAWLEERSAREDARTDRIHGAAGVIPIPLWAALFVSAGLLVVYMLFFADSGEPTVVQALMMGSVVAVIVSMLLLLQFLDHPFHGGAGGLKPTAMQRTLLLIDEELIVAGLDVDPPCDEVGNPREG